MNAKLAIVASSLLLAACAAAPSAQWGKDGTTAYQRSSDQSECQYQIEMSKAPKEQQAHLMSLCMQGKGYRMKPVQP